MSENSQTTTHPNAPFEIGLVMAGAISAGAYTAGVIDFLIQALDEWEAEKQFARENPGTQRAQECPTHEVRIKVMAGSSAGGMTAGLAAGLLGMRFESVTSQPPANCPVQPSNNTLYRSWVNTIDIDPLLGSRDLDQKGSSVQSLLDSTILRDIARDAFRFDDPRKRIKRPYVSDSLDVILTVTNLRGVPYAPRFVNWQKLMPYEMTMHADHMHFVVSDNPQTAPGTIWLDPAKIDTPESWGVLKDAALATGAFPVGLAPQLLKRFPLQYSARKWAMPGPHQIGSKHVCEYWQEIPPNWDEIEKAGPSFQYEFLCVDGGVMNNEPLDLARRVLIGDEGTELTSGQEAKHAVLMILPFPNGKPYPIKYEAPSGPFNLLTTTFNSLISQARFKPQELALANNPNVYSRFLIVPRRGYRQKDIVEPYTIACGSLGGFGGFLSRRFREHDYQLGRRNCQWFLRQYFALPSEGNDANQLFQGWHDKAREKHKMFRMKDGIRVPLNKLPIIPLCGSAVPDVSSPQWPTFTEAEFNALKPKIKRRLGRIVKALIKQNVSGWVWGPIARQLLRTVWWFKARSVVESIMQTIQDDLTERGLMAAG